MNKIFIILGFGLGLIFIVLGLLTLFGVLIPRNPIEQFDQLKWVLGIVLLLYGLYRIITTYFKLKEKDPDETN